MKIAQLYYSVTGSSAFPDARTFRAALQRQPAHRRAYVLRYLEGETLRQIGARYKRSPATIRDAIVRTIAAMHKDIMAWPKYRSVARGVNIERKKPPKTK